MKVELQQIDVSHFWQLNSEDNQTKHEYIR